MENVTIACSLEVIDGTVGTWIVAEDAENIKLAINGTLMRGLKLNSNMIAAGATFLREDRTEPAYRLWTINDDHPAMIRVSDGSGVSVEVEIWEVPPGGIASILIKEPPGLAIGKVRLEGGEMVLGVLGEPALVEHQREISAYGGWRSYIGHQGSRPEFAMDEIIWRGMTRAQLDAAYNNSAAVRNSADRLAGWIERSKSFRAERSELLDLEYGRRPRNRIDIFRCGKAHAPLLVYIHGGYWQRNAKEFFACLAEGPAARGFDTALVGYTLAPEATLTEIVGEVRMAIRWLRANGPRYGVAGAKLIVSGWSAGGHLTAMTLAEADAGIAISGIFDIEPCRLNYLNDALGMTMEEQLLLSPLHQLPSSSPPLVIAYGTAELPELQRQSRDYHDARLGAHLPSELLPLDDHDHFSILEEMANSNGKLTGALVRLAAS